jgi:hypothetical protein
MVKKNVSLIAELKLGILIVGITTLVTIVGTIDFTPTKSGNIVPEKNPWIGNSNRASIQSGLS